jgi:hypothetical protein
VAEYLPALFDTPKDQHVSISLDIGIIPNGYPDAGKYVVTIQALPLPTRKNAEVIADVLKEAIGSRLGVRFDEGTHVA